jgi:hypothetical protein
MPAFASTEAKTVPHVVAENTAAATVGIDAEVGASTHPSTNAVLRPAELDNVRAQSWATYSAQVGSELERVHRLLNTLSRDIEIISRSVARLEDRTQQLECVGDRLAETTSHNDLLYQRVEILEEKASIAEGVHISVESLADKVSLIDARLWCAQEAPTTRVAHDTGMTLGKAELFECRLAALEDIRVRLPELVLKACREHVTAVKDTMTCIDARVGALELEGAAVEQTTRLGSKDASEFAEVKEADKITIAGKVRQGCAPEFSTMDVRRMPTSSELIRRARGVGLCERECARMNVRD